MGTYTEIFTAPPTDAAIYRVVRFLELATKENSFSALQLRGVTPVELGLLWALLEKKRWSAKQHMLVTKKQIAFDDPALPRSVRRAIREMFKIMNLASSGKPIEDESVLFCFPQGFVDLLAMLDTKSQPDVARRWRRQLERRKVAQWTNSFVTRTLRGMASRAGKVRRRGPQLFLWLSP
jgi:hypothetical protein